MGIIVSGINYAGRLFFRGLGGSLTWLTPAGNVGNQFDSTPVSTRLITNARPTDNVTYMVANGQLPPGITLNILTGELTGSPLPLSDTTTFFFTVAASLNGDEAIRTFNFTVRPNFAPEWLTEENLGTLVDRETVSFSLEAEDANVGQVLTYSLVSGALPVGLTLAPNGVVSGEIAPIAQSSLRHDFTVRASDGLKFAQRSFYTSVQENTAPVWVSPEVLGEGLGGEFISIQMVANDLNGRDLIYYLDGSSSLPQGMMLESDGTLSGPLPIATVSDVDFSFSAKAYDGVFETIKSFTVTALLNLNPAFTTSSQIRAISNKAFTKSFPAIDPNEQSEITYSVVGQLPAGVSFDPVTATVSGNIASAASAQFELTIRASNGELSTDLLVTIFVAADDAPVWVTPAGLRGSALGYDIVSYPVLASDPNGLPLTYSLVSGTLPAGLGLSNGAISGTVNQPTSDTLHTFVVQASDGVSSIQREFSIFVGVNDRPQWITPIALGSYLESQPFSATIDAFDPDGRPARIDVQGGGLPTGFTYNSATRTVSGTMPAVDVDTPISFRFSATDGYDVTTSFRTFIAIAVFNKLPVWTTAAFPRAVERTPYSFQLTAQNPGNDGFTFAVTGGALPQGLSLNSATGVISGTPAATATDLDSTFEITVTNEIGSEVRQFSPTGQFTSITVQYNRDPIWTTAAGSLLTTLAKNSVEVTLAATDANATPITYTSTDLPSALTLNPTTGVLTGEFNIVQSETVYSFTVNANDGLVSVPRQFSITVLADSDPIWTTGADLGTRFDGEPQSITLVASDPERNAITYTLVSGSIPTGMTLTGNALTGTPVVTGDTLYTFEIEASDGIQTIRREFTITIVKNVAPVWVTPAGLLGEELAGYSGGFNLSATDANGETVVYTLKSGTLPSGYQLQGNRVGTVGAAVLALVSQTTDYTFTITASDGLFDVDREFTIRVLKNDAPVFNVAAGQVISANEGSDVDILLDAVDPEGRPITYDISGVGYLDIDSDGRVTGTLPSVTADRTDTFTVTAKDGSGANGNGANTSSRQYSARVLFASAPVWTTASSLPSQREGRTYSQTLVAVAGGSAVSYSLKSGSLPAGLSLAANGVLSGTLGLVNGNTISTFVVTATGLYGATDRTFTLNVIDNIAPVWVTPAGSVLTAAENETISFTLEATDADDATVTYEVVSGALPGGAVTLDEQSGVISGQLPQLTETTTYTFVVGAFDGGVRTEREFSITVQNLLAFSQYTLDTLAPPTTALYDSGEYVPGEWADYDRTRNQSVTPTPPFTATLTHSVDTGNAPVLSFVTMPVAATPTTATIYYVDFAQNSAADASVATLNTELSNASASFNYADVPANSASDASVANIQTETSPASAIQNT